MTEWQRTRVWRDSDGTIIANTYQDVEGILDDNKRSQNDPYKTDWGRPIADIPNNIAYGWLVEEWKRGNVNLRYLSAEWKALVRAKLRDPDWRWLRMDNPSNPFHIGWRA